MLIADMAMRGVATKIATTSGTMEAATTTAHGAIMGGAATTAHGAMAESTTRSMLTERTRLSGTITGTKIPAKAHGADSPDSDACRRTPLTVKTLCMKRNESTAQPKPTPRAVPSCERPAGDTDNRLGCYFFLCDVCRDSTTSMTHCDVSASTFVMA